MAFFEQTRLYFILFILLGFWTCWPDSKYKRLLRFHSIFSIALNVLNFTTTLVFNRFYSFESLSDLIANFLFISAMLTHLVILLESMFKSRTQWNFWRSFRSYIFQWFHFGVTLPLPYWTNCQYTIFNWQTHSLNITSTIYYFEFDGCVKAPRSSV